MSNGRVTRGWRTEVVVAKWLRAHGWPDARTWLREDGQRGKDVYHVTGHAVECKARYDFQPGKWLKQSKRNAGNGERPCVIVRLNGQGEDAGEYIVIRRLEDDELNRTGR